MSACHQTLINANYYGFINETVKHRSNQDLILTYPSGLDSSVLFWGDNGLLITVSFPSSSDEDSDEEEDEDEDGSLWIRSRSFILFQRCCYYNNERRKLNRQNAIQRLVCCRSVWVSLGNNVHTCWITDRASSLHKNCLWKLEKRPIRT